jgi:hypothetical protein
MMSSSHVFRRSGTFSAGVAGNSVISVTGWRERLAGVCVDSDLSTLREHALNLSFRLTSGIPQEL